MKRIMVIAMLVVGFTVCIAHAADQTTSSTTCAQQVRVATIERPETFGRNTPEKVKIFTGNYESHKDGHGGYYWSYENFSNTISSWLTENKGRIRLTSRPDVTALANGNVVVIVYHYVELEPEKSAESK